MAICDATKSSGHTQVSEMSQTYYFLPAHLGRHLVAALRHMQQRRVRSHLHPFPHAEHPVFANRTNTTPVTGSAPPTCLWLPVPDQEITWFGAK